MELVRLFRKRAVLPWAIFGGICLCLTVIPLLISPKGDVASVLILLAAYLLCGLAFTFRAVSGMGAKQFRHYLSSLDEAEAETLCRQFRERQNRDQAVLTDRCVVLMTRQSLLAIPYGDVVWAYQAGQMTRLGGKVYTMIVVTKDRKTHLMDLHGSGDGPAEAFLANLRHRAPGIYLGRERDTVQLYKNDFEAMKTAVERRRIEGSPE